MEELIEKILPNDKRMLLDKQTGYEIYSRDIVRKVFPRIFADANELYEARGMTRRPMIRDIVPFYFLLLSYVSGVYTKADGNPNERFGSCFLSYPAITKHLRIDKSRIIWISTILEANGLIHKEKVNVNMRWEVRYFPLWAPHISEDGYVIDKNGVRNIPEYIDIYLPKKSR